MRASKRRPTTKKRDAAADAAADDSVPCFRCFLLLLIVPSPLLQRQRRLPKAAPRDGALCVERSAQHAQRAAHAKRARHVAAADSETLTTSGFFTFARSHKQ